MKVQFRVFWHSKNLVVLGNSLSDTKTIIQKYLCILRFVLFSLLLYVFLTCNICPFCHLCIKKSTRKSTAPPLMTGMKAIRLKIATTSLCSSPTLKKGDVDLRLEESRLTQLWRGCLLSLAL